MSRPPTQHAFGSTAVGFDAARVHPTGAPAGPHNSYGAASTVSADELVRVLGEIADEARLAGYRAGDAADAPRIDALYRSMWDRYKDFSREFPVVFRWTVHTQEASAPAFRQYLAKHHLPFWKDRREMLRAQAEYLVLKFRAEHRRTATAAVLATYRTNVTAKLLEEEEQYAEAAKEAEAASKENAARHTALLRQALLAAAERAAAGDVLCDAPRPLSSSSSPA